MLSDGISVKGSENRASANFNLITPEIRTYNRMNQELKLHFQTKRRITRTHLLLIMILGLGSSLGQLLLTEPETPENLFINWNVVFGQISFYARLLTIEILQYVQNFIKRYGVWRSILYLVFVSFMSYVCVAQGLDRTATLLWEYFEGNVIRRLDNSIVIIEENRNESTSMRRVKEKPKSIEEHSRYNGEDVRFRCYDVMTFDADVEPVDMPVIWRRNGELVLPSEKVKIEFSFQSINDSDDSSRLYSYWINSTLTIYLVEDSDFGNYTCHLRNAAKVKDPVFQPETSGHQQPKQKDAKPGFRYEYYSVYSPCTCTCFYMSFEDFVRQFEQMLAEFYYFVNLQEPIQVSKEDVPKANAYDWTGLFMLTKVTKSVRTVSAPPGGIVSISASYLNLAERQDVSLGYVINDQAYHEVCGGQLEGCSFIVWVYWTLWHATGNFGPIPNVFLYWLKMQSSILGIAWQCACPSSYGNHVFRFFRHFYNTTSQSNEIIEVEHPHSIKLIPRTADILLVFQNESIPKPLGVECLGSSSLIGVCSSMTEFIREFHNYYFLIENIIVYVLFVLAILITYTVNKLTMYIVIACRNVILEGHFWHDSLDENKRKMLGNIGHTNIACKYDVYISHADAQIDLAAGLTSILEAAGMKVFYRDRDVAIGDLTIEVVASAIVSSRMFIIIASKEFTERRFHNSYEFCLMLNQIHEQKVDERNVMLLKLGQCNIGTYFSNYTDMNIIAMESLSPEEFLNLFKNWFCGKKSTKPYVFIETLGVLCVCLIVGLLIAYVCRGQLIQRVGVS